MIVQLAYHPSTVSVCREHYDRPPATAPTLGPILDSREQARGCLYCEVERLGRQIQEREADRERVAREVEHAHMRQVHADGSECPDGCGGGL